MKLWDCILKKLGFKPKPNVLLIDSNGCLTLATSEFLNDRRVVHHSGGVLALLDNGTVRGSYYLTKWEAL